MMKSASSLFKFSILYFSTIVVFIICSCNGNSSDQNSNEGSVDDSIKVDTLNISWDDLKSDTAQVGDVICIRGYIGNPGNYINITNGKMTVPIFERRNQQAGFRIQLSIPTGTEPNHVHDLPEEFYLKILKLFLPQMKFSPLEIMFLSPPEFSQMMSQNLLAMLKLFQLKRQII